MLPAGSTVNLATRYHGTCLSFPAVIVPKSESWYLPVIHPVPDRSDHLMLPSVERGIILIPIIRGGGRDMAQRLAKGGGMAQRLRNSPRWHSQEVMEWGRKCGP